MFPITCPVHPPTSASESANFFFATLANDFCMIWRPFCRDLCAKIRQHQKKGRTRGRQHTSVMSDKTTLNPFCAATWAMPAPRDRRINLLRNTRAKERVTHQTGSKHSDGLDHVRWWPAVVAIELLLPRSMLNAEKKMKSR